MATFPTWGSQRSSKLPEIISLEGGKAASQPASAFSMSPGILLPRWSWRGIPLGNIQAGGEESLSEAGSTKEERERKVLLKKKKKEWEKEKGMHFKI